MEDLQRQRATSEERNFIEWIKAPTGKALAGGFSNRDNVRVPIQFKESQPQYFKIRFLLKNRPIHFYINRNKVIRRVKQNQLSFSSTEINKPFPAPEQCLGDQI